MKRLRLLAFFALLPLLPVSVHAVPIFSAEASVRVSSGLPQAVTGNLPSEIRLFFLRDFQILSATSTDGLTFSEESGVRISSAVNGGAVVFSSVTSAGVLPLAAGGFRMAFSVTDSGGNFRIVTATSSDGLTWENETGTGFSIPAATYAGSVRLALMPTGGWRMFYVRAASVGFSSSTFRVFTATSGDEGQSWSVSTQVYTDEAHDIGIAPRTDGSLRLFYTAPLTGQTTASQILSADSAGVQNPGFSKESGVRLSIDVSQGEMLSPLPVRGNPDYTWRLYSSVALTGSTEPQILSALADAPDVHFVIPGSATRTSAPSAHAITGEIFASTVTVVLRRPGETDIPGTDVSRISDQSMTATFDTLNRTTGSWDVVVTNSDGTVGTLTGGFSIDIESAVFVITDNVFHPVRGEKASVAVTIFEAGKVTLRIFTLDGRLVRTLQDGDLPLGLTTILWDGGNDEGRLVASGAYFIEAKGPRLGTRQKIVVIK